MNGLPPSERTERGIPQVGRPRRGNRWLMLVVIAVGIVLVIALSVRAMLGALANRNPTSHVATLAPALPDLTRSAFDKETAPPPPMVTPTASTAGAQASVPLTPAQKAAADLAERRKRAPLLVLGGSAPANQADSSSTAM